MECRFLFGAAVLLVGYWMVTVKVVEWERVPEVPVRVTV